MRRNMEKRKAGEPRRTWSADDYLVHQLRASDRPPRHYCVGSTCWAVEEDAWGVSRFKKGPRQPTEVNYTAVSNSHNDVGGFHWLKLTGRHT